MGCLLSYRSVYDVYTVKNSFLGANLALKLHLADKVRYYFFCLQIYFSDQSSICVNAFFGYSFMMFSLFTALFSYLPCTHKTLVCFHCGFEAELFVFLDYVW
jgi:hypothetical protein